MRVCLMPMSSRMAHQSTRKKIPARDSKTQQEIDRQHTLLAADLDKRALKGNAKVEDWRHYKEFTGLSKKEKRERFQIQLKRNEILDDLKKVRQGCTGHYDESKSPIENIQSALKQQFLTPLRSSRLDVPHAYPVRKTKSMEHMPVEKSGCVSQRESEIQQRPESVHLVKKPTHKRTCSNK